MPTYNEIKDIIKDQYTIDQEVAGMILFRVELKTGDKQMVGVGQNKEWLLVMSPIGVLPNNMLSKAIELVSRTDHGGIIFVNDIHCVRISIPLESCTEEILDFLIPVIASIAGDIKSNCIG
jgi:hypothetical protein